jgi:hypothetical protein
MFKLFTNKKLKKKEWADPTFFQGGKLGPQNGIMLAFWGETSYQNDVI